jgi:hypothetical protein
VRKQLELAALLLILAPPAFAQRGPRLEVSVLANSPPSGAAVVAARLLDDSKIRELLRSGFPAAMTFRLELWRAGGLFDELENTTQWNVFVSYDPYSQQYRAARRHGNELQEDFGEFATLEAAEARIARRYEVRLLPQRAATRYYYNVVLDIESLSVSDLDELQRWLRGELEPAVRGKRAPLSALRRGFGTLLSRLLGGETRHYESRSGTFSS